MGERSSLRAINVQEPRQIQAVMDKYCMASFRRWLAENKRREWTLGPSEPSEGSAALPDVGSLGNPDIKKLAKDYAASFHDPIVLGRIRKAMEAESQAMQRKLGVKTTRRRQRLGR